MDADSSQREHDRQRGGQVSAARTPARGRVNTDVLYEGLDRTAIRRTELAFLAHLARKGLPVQTPVPNLHGDCLTMLPGNVCAMLLTWLPGHTPGEEDVADNVCFLAGAMSARMLNVPD